MIDKHIKAHRGKIALRTVNESDRAETRQDELVSMLVNLRHLADEWGIDWKDSLKQTAKIHKTDQSHADQ